MQNKKQKMHVTAIARIKSGAKGINKTWPMRWKPKYMLYVLRMA
jgi:hypothetical protein